MTPAYSPLNILRQIDNLLLAEYAEHHKLFEDFDITALKQTDITPIYDNILALETRHREDVEKNLRQIDAFANKRCIQMLFDELKAHEHDIPEFQKKLGYHDKAMWALLHHPQLFHDILRLTFPYAIKRHWHKFPFPAGHALPHFNTQDIARLEQAIGLYFQKRDGRGKHCKIEHHRFQGNEYLIAYPSDYPDVLTEWLDNGEFERRAHRLAFLVIFIFKRDGTSVEVYVDEPLGVKQDLFRLWAKEMLQLDNVETSLKRSYNLTFFHNRNPNILFPPGSPVKALAVQKIRFAAQHNPTVTYTVEEDISNNKYAVYDELERKQLSIRHIKHISLKATLQSHDTDKTITRGFELSGQTCSLKHEDEAGIIRQFLKDVGIDETP